MRTGGMLKTIVTLAVPIILENVFQTLLGTADTYFAGQLGDNAIAAIGVTNLVMNVFISFFFAVGVGTSAVMSRCVGKKDFRQANEAMEQSLLLGLALGLSFGLISLALRRPILMLAGAKGAVLDYAVPYYTFVAVPCVFLCLSQILASCLRSTMDTKTPMVSTGIANVLNIFLDYVLVRLGMGIIGLAAATTIARLLVTCLLLLRLRAGKGEICLRLTRVRWNRAVMGSIVRIGLPAGGEKLIMRVGQMVYNGIIISLGTASFVAHSIGGTIDNYTYIPAFGFGMAAATLVGISLGEEDVAKARKITFVAYGISAACMVGLGILMYLFAPQLAAQFTKTQEVRDMIVMVVRLIAFFQPFGALTQVLTCALQGAGDTQFPMGATLAGIWAVRVGLGYFLAVPLHWGLLGVWMGYVADVVLRGLLLLLRFTRRKTLGVRI